MTKYILSLYPFISFVASGWFVAVYLILQPGFTRMMNEVPEGVVLNVVSPTIWLLIAGVINALGWVSIMFDPLELTLESNKQS